MRFESGLDVRSWNLVRQAEGDDAADGGSRDKVESGRNGGADLALQICDDGNGVKPEITTSAQAENLERHGVTRVLGWNNNWWPQRTLATTWRVTSLDQASLRSDSEILWILPQRFCLLWATLLVIETVQNMGVLT
jgi:hypothetical protein